MAARDACGCVNNSAVNKSTLRQSTVCSFHSIIATSASTNSLLHAAKHLQRYH
jgi:hypothetical protein